MEYKKERLLYIFVKSEGTTLNGNGMNGTGMIGDGMKVEGNEWENGEKVRSTF